jgi:hypothetical protein
MQVGEYLSKLSISHLKECLNIYLVYQGGRPGAQVVDIPETVQFIKLLNDSGVRMVFAYPQHNELLILPYPITTYNQTHMSVVQRGKLLGYACAGEEFHRMDQPRVVLSFVESTYGFTMYSEVCNLLTFDSDTIHRFVESAQLRIAHWNQLMQRARLIYQFQFQQRSSVVHPNSGSLA